MEHFTRKVNKVNFHSYNRYFFFEFDFVCVCRRLSRTNENTIICDEYAEFQIIETDLSSTSLRFLLFCTDHSGIQDLLIENIIPLNQEMIPKYDQVILLHNLPQVCILIYDII